MAEENGNPLFNIMKIESKEKTRDWRCNKIKKALLRGLF